jgi:hypothetical protein
MTGKNTLDLSKPGWEEKATRAQLIEKVKNQRTEIGNLLDINRRAIGECTRRMQQIDGIKKTVRHM